MAPDLRFQHGLPAHLTPDAARLYWQAFSAKLGRILGPDDRAVAYFERVIQPKNCLCALSDTGQLLGLSGLGSPDGGFAGGTLADLAQIYGTWGAWWRRGLMSALSRDEDPGRLLIDGLCVDARHRGQGIGSRLIQAAEDIARAKALPQVQIDVAVENHRAILLYQRLGYSQINRLSTGPLRWVFGISATLTMVKELRSRS